ncbi:MAG: hypothetical protein KBC64_04175 [Simkaniaceae bacterium]|nr:hypothetical protein [Simkaniaceae bacterium]
MDENQDKTPPQHCPQSNACSRVSYEFYGDFLYLQPNGSQLCYAVEAFPFDNAIAVPPASPNWRVFEIDPNYTPAFQVGFKTFFPTNDTNLEVNWERLHSHDSASMQVATDQDMVGPMSNIGPNSFAYAKAHGRATFHFDSSDLLFGKQICFFDRLYMNLQFGASFARIKQTLNSHYEDVPGTTIRKIESPSTFTGGGAKLNVDFDYQIYRGLSFTGNTSIALLMGHLKNSQTYQSYAPALTTQGIPQPNVQTTRVPNRTQAIPSFEEKLGFAYAVKFNNCCELNFGIGYQLQVFLNAIQTFDMTSPQVLPSLFTGGTVQEGVYAVGFARRFSDFILTGPYFSASLRF